MAAQNIKTKDGWSGSAPLFDINYGAVRNIHLHALVQATYDRPIDGEHNYGVGDTEIGAKIRFLEETSWRPQAAIYPAIELPTGDDQKNLGAGHTQAFLPLWIQKTWERWTTYGGGGYWINPGDGNKNWIYLGWALQRKVSERLMMGGELFHRSADTVDGSSSDGYTAGGTYDFSREYHLLLAAGRDFTGPNRFTGYVAIQWTN
jgi:hypothetical protein